MARETFLVHSDIRRETIGSVGITWRLNGVKGVRMFTIFWVHVRVAERSVGGARECFTLREALKSSEEF